MVHTIGFQNLTQTQNNQSLMEEIENQEMKKISEQSIGRNRIDRKLSKSRSLPGSKDIQTKTTTKYSNTKVKTRNLLTNVSYRRYKPEDVEKTNFVIDVFLFSTHNLNSTGLDRKLETSLERD